MNRQYIALGGCPEDELFVETNGATKEYMPLMMDQVQAYLKLLQTRFKDMLKENNKLELKIEQFGNDTQPFLNVIVYYDADDEIQTQCATLFSENLPKTWEDKSEFYVCL